MRKLFLSILIMVALLSQNLFADPNQEVNYLLNTPVSKLDWGIFHLMQKLNNYRINNKDNPQVFVTFDERKQRIMIDARIDDKGKTSTEAKQLCVDTIAYLKSDLGIDAKTGKPYQGNHSDLYFYFGVYNSEPPPSSLPIWLDRNTSVSAKIFYENKDNNLPLASIECISDLTSTKIFYAK